MTIVVVHELVKRYSPDAPPAVDGVSFEIKKGEIFSLLGPNGAGKTTTISVISTLLHPDGGTVQVLGFDVVRAPLAVRQRVGVVPQEIALYGELTAAENLRFWGEMRGLQGAELRREVAEKLALAGLEERAHARVKTFSGGMKRRLNLAVGLLGSPPLILMDEPTAGVDPQSRRHLLDRVKALRDAGLTILYTTHYMEEAQELSDRIGIIDHGHLIALGTLSELVQMVGEHETLVLGLAKAEGGQALAGEIVGLEGIAAATADDGNITVSVTSAAQALPVVLTRAAGLGVSIRTIEVREPDLEAVFLHLTGRTLRD
ncbi:MAG TPA: ABC transporter ATP-binding protein [Chloroflexi bacterium]|nr:ABC transporter ATP-binding protein [Chloroflexota bacterium]